MADDTEVPAALHPPVSEHGAGLEALIDKWWADHFPGSVVARYTECWNYAHSAKEALKALLKTSLARSEIARGPQERGG
jgi:hypothetical protein